MTEHLLTRDRIAKRLEIEAIARHVKNGMTVLDVGCGDGETLCELASRFEIGADGLDSSEAMISVARQRNVTVATTFWVGDIIKSGLRHLDGRYDLVYTERTIVCLSDWETQQRAIVNIARCLKPGGLYVMCECSQDGLDAVNAMRGCVGLPAIIPPSWDRYLRDDEVEAFATDSDNEKLYETHDITGGAYVLTGRVVYPVNHIGLRLEGIEDYSGTYYFLSRVVNARLAADEGREPDYDASVNRLALSLPPIVGLRGQGRIWTFRRKA